MLLLPLHRAGAKDMPGAQDGFTEVSTLECLNREFQVSSSVLTIYRVGCPHFFNFSFKLYWGKYVRIYSIIMILVHFQSFPTLFTIPTKHIGTELNPAHIWDSISDIGNFFQINKKNN